MCMYTEAIAGRQSSVGPCLTSGFLSQSSPFWPLGPACLRPQCWGYMRVQPHPAIYVDAEDSDSVPHACRANTLTCEAFRFLRALILLNIINIID